ncbi:hypothetical protein M5689_013391 [Euphorbia peplus]|nr:hypothetical protein M5689_013391 [Euphorbia peplus]
MATLSSDNQKLNSRNKDNENDYFMGAILSPKSGVDLMLNCDLPPPTKLFTGPDQMALSRAFGLIAREEQHEETMNNLDVYGTEKAKLLKAVALSQTRAREAEEKATRLVKEKDMICNAFLKESMQLLAYRHWIRFLEIQVFKLQQENNKKSVSDCEDMMDGFSWFAALAICFGIAFGCTYLS